MALNQKMLCAFFPGQRVCKNKDHLRLVNCCIPWAQNGLVYSRYLIDTLNRGMEAIPAFGSTQNPFSSLVADHSSQQALWSLSASHCQVQGRTARPRQSAGVPFCAPCACAVAPTGHSALAARAAARLARMPGTCRGSHSRHCFTLTRSFSGGGIVCTAEC